MKWDFAVHDGFDHVENKKKTYESIGKYMKYYMGLCSP